MIHDPIWMDHFIAARAGMDADMARRVPWARTQVYCIRVQKNVQRMAETARAEQAAAKALQKAMAA